MKSKKQYLAPVPAIPKILPSKILKGKSTGFVHLEKIKGAWWLIDHEGNAFWDLGMSMVGYPAPGSWYSKMNHKYAETIVKKYPEPEEWAKIIWEMLDNLGFTSLYAGCDATLKETRKRGKFFYVLLMLSRNHGGNWKDDFYLRDAYGRLPADSATRFPDPFNAEWREYARGVAKEAVSKYKDDKTLIGYFIDNEIVASGDRNLFKYFWSEYCLREMLSWIRKRYKNSIEALNKAWLTAIPSFDEISREILRLVEFPHFRTPQAHKDLVDFERFVVETYVDFTLNLMRELDPNHLIIGNRFAGSFTYMEWEPFDLFGKYDLVAVNFYPFKGPFLSKEELKRIKTFHKLTGKPIIMSEFNFSSRETRRIKWVWGYTVNTHRERAEGYKNFIAQVSALPYVVGAHWFQLVDAFDVEDYNAGLLQENGEPYPLLADAMRETNRKAVHSKRGTVGKSRK